jgi:hypothetical protein
MDKRILSTGAIALVLVIGLAVGSGFNAIQSSAQTSTQTPSQPTNMAPKEQTDESKATHVGANGKREELLTGDAAQKVTSAAQAALAGGTIQRVETDAEGAAYEAHATKSDGSRVTVKLDSSFKVTGVEEGRGMGRH